MKLDVLNELDDNGIFRINFHFIQQKTAETNKARIKDNLMFWSQETTNMNKLGWKSIDERLEWRLQANLKISFDFEEKFY